MTWSRSLPLPEELLELARAGRLDREGLTTLIGSDPMPDRRSLWLFIHLIRQFLDQRRPELAGPVLDHLLVAPQSPSQRTLLAAALLALSRTLTDLHPPACATLVNDGIARVFDAGADPHALLDDGDLGHVLRLAGNDDAARRIKNIFARASCALLALALTRQSLPITPGGMGWHSAKRAAEHAHHNPVAAQARTGHSSCFASGETLTLPRAALAFPEQADLVFSLLDYDTVQARRALAHDLAWVVSAGNRLYNPLSPRNPHAGVAGVNFSAHCHRMLERADIEETPALLTGSPPPNRRHALVHWLAFGPFNRAGRALDTYRRRGGRLDPETTSPLVMLLDSPYQPEIQAFEVLCAMHRDQRLALRRPRHLLARAAVRQEPPVVRMLLDLPYEPALTQDDFDEILGRRVPAMRKPLIDDDTIAANLASIAAWRNRMQARKLLARPS